jgi:hypothetical protein
MDPIAQRGPAGNRSRSTQRRPRTIDPRLIAPLAFVLSIIALALVIVYAVGRFVQQTIQAVPAI